VASDNPKIASGGYRVLKLYAQALLVGMVAGLGAVFFRGLIGLVHNLLFLGKLSVFYNANVHTPIGPFGPLVILSPCLAAVIVVYLVKNFAPEAKGHGVPEVMEAIHYNRGIIRPIVAVIKSVASALSIGSGGSAGREGPMIQVGASFGSTLGQWLAMPAWQRITLIAGGAGGGIAASFNTPIGGILFAVEIVLHELSVRTLVPVAISTVTATYVSRLFFGARPSFVIPKLEIPGFGVSTPEILLSYAVLGIIMGGAATLFIKSLYAYEALIEKHVKNYYVRHTGSMFLIGAAFYAMMLLFGQYYIEGVGYATVQDVLTESLTAPLFLLLLFLLKLAATSMTLGSGASGGVFSPGFFMGAMVGGAYGVILNRLFPGMNFSPSALAVAGMAGMIGGSTGAAVAAIVMIFEMTLDYNVIFPMTITVALAYGVRTIFSAESIYTMKPALRGHPIPKALRSNVLQVKRVGDVMRPQITVLPSSASLEAFSRTVLDHPEEMHFLVADGDRLAGVVGREAAAQALDGPRSEKTLAEAPREEFIVVSPKELLLNVIAEMHARGVNLALAADNAELKSPSDVRGIVTELEAAEMMIHSVDLFCDY
jgi:CIC family chloride channel protein